MVDRQNILTDLSSVDECFARIFDEEGVNAFPEVCDGYDMSFFSLDNNSNIERFVNIETNLQKMIEKLKGEISLGNEESVGLLIDNLVLKLTEIQNCKVHFKEKDFNFCGLYVRLKKIQNQLGLNFSLPAMNVLALSEVTIDVEELNQKYMEYIELIKKFMAVSARAYNEFMNERALGIDAKAENTNISKEEPLQFKAANEKKTPAAAKNLGSEK
ncbi:MAG: hypothetical protein RR400_00035 [Clostridia bacterium]